ncbi:MAG TPA: hypothetical protein VG713_14935 [Pirellulales bacterium]|nr:hypothetical protein [Pirellulales bacterium]
MTHRSTLFALAVVCFVAAARPAEAERVVLVAGGDEPVAALPATRSKLDGPFGVDFNSAGEMFIVEISGHRVLKLDRAGILTLFGGTGAKGDTGDGGPARAATFNGMHSLAIAPDGTIYIADTWNNRVRAIDPRTGKIRALAGAGGPKGYTGDGGPATEAHCGGVYCVAMHPHRPQLYLVDLDNKRVRMVNLADGLITTVAGNGQRGVPDDGADADAAPLVDPRAVAVDSKENVYILERGGHALRVVDPAGKIRTVAGTGEAGLAGDGGDALKAKLKGPKHICIDPHDNVLIADTDNHVVRKYLPKDNKIVRVAGCGRKGASGIDGPPLELEMNQPHGVCFDRAGTLYITDSYNNRVLKVVD